MSQNQGKKIQHHHILYGLVGMLAILLSFSLGIAGTAYYHLEQRVVLLNQETDESQNQLSAQLAQAELQAVKAQESAEEAQKSLEDEQVSRQDLEDRLTEVQLSSDEQISELQGQLADSSTDVSTVVQKWNPRVAYIYCKYNSYSSGTGSGIAIAMSDGSVWIVTNKHVITENGYGAEYCGVILPDNDQVYIVELSGIKVATSGSDWGVLEITDVDSALRTQSAFPKLCSSTPSLGDRIIVLGYPTIGSASGVTVTTGLISGFDDDYFVTDAKIEHGNSGGAAILVGDDCLLGIPTAALTGSIESFGRILDINVIF